VRKPAEAFILDLGERLSRTYPTVVYDTRRNGAGSLMRIHRDVRFSPDKRPLKENVGIIFPLAPGMKVEVPSSISTSPWTVLLLWRASTSSRRKALSRTAPRWPTSVRPALVASWRIESVGRYMEDPATADASGVPADHPRAALSDKPLSARGCPFPEDLGRSDLVDRCAARRRPGALRMVGR
jgi:uncharacterized protein (DUF2461 family)